MGYDDTVDIMTTMNMGNMGYDDTVDGSEIPFPTTWDGAKTL